MEGKFFIPKISRGTDLVGRGWGKCQGGKDKRRVDSVFVCQDLSGGEMQGAGRCPADPARGHPSYLQWGPLAGVGAPLGILELLSPEGVWRYRALPSLAEPALFGHMWTQHGHARWYNSSIPSCNLQNRVDGSNPSYLENRWKILPRSYFFSLIPKKRRPRGSSGPVHLAAPSQPLRIGHVLGRPCGRRWGRPSVMSDTCLPYSPLPGNGRHLHTSFPAQLSGNLSDGVLP